MPDSCFEVFLAQLTCVQKPDSRQLQEQALSGVAQRMNQREVMSRHWRVNEVMAKMVRCFQLDSLTINASSGEHWRCRNENARPTSNDVLSN